MILLHSVKPINDSPEITLIVPCLNEAPILKANLLEMHSFLRGLNTSFELIVADDGSTDATGIILADLATRLPELVSMRNPVNLGKGGAVRAAMKRASGRLVGFLDADLEIPVRYLPELLAAVRAGSDIAVGSKFAAGGSTTAQRHFARTFAHKVYQLLEQVFLGGALSDDQCGIKVFRREALEQILPESIENGWTWDTEMMTLAMKAGMTIREFPVETCAVRPSRVRIVRDIIRTIRGLLRLRGRGIRIK